MYVIVHAWAILVEKISHVSNLSFVLRFLAPDFAAAATSCHASLSTCTYNNVTFARVNTCISVEIHTAASLLFASVSFIIIIPRIAPLPRQDRNSRHYWPSSTNNLSTCPHTRYPPSLLSLVRDVEINVKSTLPLLQQLSLCSTASVTPDLRLPSQPYGVNAIMIGTKLCWLVTEGRRPAHVCEQLAQRRTRCRRGSKTNCVSQRTAVEHNKHGTLVTCL